MTRPLISSRLRWGVVLASLVAVDFAFTMSPASAACHAFTVSASPSTVNEGGAITVTVTRDAAVNPSAVDVRTVDGSARTGQDFGGGRRTISFTTETQKSYTIPTVNDTAREGAETFRIELVPGSGSGCAVHPEFVYGSPVTVTIRASDQVTAPATASPKPSPARSTHRATAAPTVTSPSAPPVTTASTATPTATGRPAATTAPPVPSSSASPTATAAPVATTGSEDDGTPIGPIIGVLVLAAVVGAAGTYLVRRRRLSG